MNNRYLIGITLVVTLGGLLFGYDTAVISGTVTALESFFIKPLFDDPVVAVDAISQYKFIITLCILMILGFVWSFLKKVYSLGTKTITLGSIISVAALVLMVAIEFNIPEVMSDSMASSLKGFTISSALIGCIIGGAMGGYVSQALGRKRGLMLAAILFLVSAIGSAWPDYLNIFAVHNISSLIIYRIIGGIGVGIASMLSPMYIAEIAPANVRGKLVSLNQFAIIFGMLLVYFVNYAIAMNDTEQWLNSIGWRYMFASELIPASLFFILLIFIPETPRYLIMTNKDSEAMSLLNKIQGEKEAKAEYDSVKLSLSNKNNNKRWLSYGGLVLLVGILISFFQQAVGINVVLYYAPEILKTMGLSTDSSLFQTIIVGIINLTFTVVAILTVDRFGRKPLMIIGALVMSFSMLLLGLTFYFNSVGMGSFICMLLYTAAFAMSWGPVAWVLISEIFPNSIRGAMSISVAVQWLANFAVSWSFPILNESKSLTSMFNHGFAYWMYSLMGIIAAIFIWKMVPETKNKTLEDMENLWTKKRIF